MCWGENSGIALGIRMGTTFKMEEISEGVEILFRSS